jgi:predicted MFS family arabinose efflux permease
MFKIATALFVFLGGFAVMVLEIIGTLYLAKDFGGSFYVWTSQIGVILIALALGYAIGGTLADRFHRAGFLAIPMAVAGFFIYFIPQFTQPMLDAIVNRHPRGQDLPEIWVKLDPVLGSAVVFFLPCFVLALISPYMVRMTARRVESVGTISGLIYAASTVGSIAGVFISGYVFIDRYGVTTIFQRTGLVVLFLAVLSLAMDKMLKPPGPGKSEKPTGAGSP